MNNYDLFVQAIQERKKLRVTFTCPEEGIITHTCVPLDFGMFDGREWFACLDIDTKQEIKILPQHLLHLVITPDEFETRLIKKRAWHIAREWL